VRFGSSDDDSRRIVNGSIRYSLKNKIREGDSVREVATLHTAILTRPEQDG
jgi:hypothetical protein